MATPRAIRRFAFQLLFQIDARGGVDNPAALLADIEESETLTPSERDKAAKLALNAYADRTAADAVMAELAPTWPAHRQAAVDRSILRLAHYEMTKGATNPKIAVNEAVELAKAFSTEKSPAFVNGLLDKVLKRVLAQTPSAAADSTEETEPVEETDAAGESPSA
jgi:transcription antitermination protein NusB